jgi:hypothetical protein
MANDVRTTDAHIAYPTNRVVGSIVDPKHAQAAIEALLHVGFARPDIDILHGEEDLHRPDPTDVEHRFLSQFQRTLTRSLADEHQHLRHYIEDVRAGRWVIMVLAKKREQQEAAADILGTFGAESIEFFGRWAWHSLERHPAAPTDGSIPDPTPGRTYEIDLAGTAIRVRMDSESRVTILRKSAGSPDLSRVPVTHLKPQLLMITWQEADRTTNVHVYDFESGEAHAVVSYYNRTVHRARGTVRRVD